MGFFGTDIDIDYTEASKIYTWVDKKKHLVVCNKCEGTGRERSPYGGLMDCRFCDGLGSLKIKITKKAKK